MKDEKLLKTPKKLLPGSGLPYHQFKEPVAEILQTFENPDIRVSNDNYIITFHTNEATSLCPLTHQPDYYELIINYIPNKKCIESKSAKLYLGAYRNYAGFIETIAKKILDDWVKTSEPKWCQIRIKMNPRGGIGIEVTKDYKGISIR